MRVLDLFCGMGGLAAGFAAAGDRITGVDKSAVAGTTFELNGYGKFIQKDLLKEKVEGSYQIIIGGPPCRPWSTVNTRRRGREHHDYRLIGTFFEHVIRLRPHSFLLENVVPLANSGILTWWLRKVKMKGYAVDMSAFKYSEFGASTSRRRLFVFGTLQGDSKAFKDNLDRRKAVPTTVKSRIWHLNDKAMGEVPNHVWPQLTTIEKYRSFYEKGKYGWYKLKWGEPAPSFGNVMKTYILHPESLNGDPRRTRVISIREAALVMGFDDPKFPAGVGMGSKYQMIADSVSPVFSKLVAEIMRK